MKHSVVNGIFTQSLIIIRGLPGSGKSTLAASLNKQRDYIHIEADMWWHRNAECEYKFDFEQLSYAHRWAQQSVEAFLADGNNVMVSNTNLLFKEAKPYVHFAKLIGATIEVYTMDKDINYGNIHTVPEEVMNRMYNKMVDHDIFMEQVIAYRPN